MNNTKIVLFLLSFFFSSDCLFAQQWTQAISIAEESKEAIGQIATDAAQNTYLSGTFDQEINIGNQTLTSLGFDDVFLSKRNPNGEFEWAISGGGSNFDQISALEVDGQNDIIWGGQFWIEGHFGNLTLELIHDSRGIFLLKHASDGSLIWGQSMEGEGLKILQDIISDADNNIYLTGYFENSLILKDTTLLASGVQSLFLLKLNSDGQLLWARSAGYQGEVRPQALALHPEGGVYIAGDFRGRVAFANDSIRTHTEDHDIFLAAYDSTGMPLWGRRAGGVYEDNCTAIDVDDSGRVYLTGTFLGVIALNDDLEIQTDGFNENFFLMSYTPEGNPWLARSLGSTADEAGKDILIEENLLYITGHYYGQLKIDDFFVSGSEDHFNGFVAAFDLEGKVRWLEAFKSSEYIEGNSLAAAGAERLLMAGNFAKDASLGAFFLAGEGLNDIFLAEINPLLSAGISPEFEKSTRTPVRVFPNPGNGKIHFSWQTFVHQEAYHLKIIDLYGRVISTFAIPQGQEEFVWNSEGLAAGIYYYQVSRAGQVIAGGRLVLLE